MKSDFFSLIYTKSSGCVHRRLFKGRNTIFVPDFFVIMSWMSIFLPTIPLDISIIFCLITLNAWWTIVALLTCSCLHSVCGTFINTAALDKHSFFCNKAVLLFVYFFGYGPIVICLKILLLNYKIWNSLTLDSEIFPFPIFHVSNENLSTLKTYLFIYVVLKCIPQMFILCILLVEKKFQASSCWFLLTACIFINMVIFSKMIASLLPIRKTPAYYITTEGAVLNGIIKFLATMCACCIKIELFSMAFREMSYYAFLTHIVLSLVWLWPCLKVLRSQPTLLTKFKFGIYFILFMLVFSFIYIHPFEGKGLTYYYGFYLINLFCEMYLLYTWCNPNTLEITYYFCLKIFLFGLLSCFIMTNITLRYWPPENKMITQSETIENDVENSGKHAAGGDKKEPREEGYFFN